MEEDIPLLLNIIGVGNLLLLSVYQFKRKKQQFIERYTLSFIFLILSWISLNTVLNHSGYNELFYGFESISNSLPFALASTLYLYIKYNYCRVSINLWLLHLIPFFCYLFLVTFSLFTSFKIFGYDSQIVLEGILYQICWNFYFFFYLLKLFILIKNKKQSLSFFSKVLIFGVLLTWIVNLALFLYRYIYNPMPSNIHLNVTLFFSGVSVIYLYATLKEVPQKRDYFANVKSDIEIDSNEFVNVIIEKKIYSNPDLNIRILSNEINIPYYKVSAFIHSAFNQNFNEFINSIRVKIFIKEVLQNSHQTFTIKGLSNKVGFKSTSAFYKAFKKETGTTPTKYIQAL